MSIPRDVPCHLHRHAVSIASPPARPPGPQGTQCVLASEHDLNRGQPQAARRALESLAEASPRSTWLAFSQKEIELLWLVLQNGAPEDTNSLGISEQEVQVFRGAANRIGQAGSMRILF